MTAGRELRRWTGRLLLAGTAGLVGLVLAEGLLRIAWENPAPGLYTVSERDFQRIPGIFAPGLQVVMQPGSRFEHVVTIDSLGFRGPPFPRQKTSGELRVFFTGDSFTWGHNVQDHETLPAQLQDRLLARCPQALVINGGLSGSTILAQEQLIDRAMDLDPDVVILMFHENDIDELMYVRIWDQLAENRRRKSTFPLSLLYPIVREARLTQLALHVRRLHREQGTPTVTQGARAIPPGSEPEVARAHTEYGTRLAAVAAALADRGVYFVFVAFPHPASVAAGSGGPHYAPVLAMAHASGIPTVDLLPALAAGAEPLEALYLIPEDYHPSPAGHSLAASRIDQALREDPFAPTCAW